MTIGDDKYLDHGNAGTSEKSKTKGESNKASSKRSHNVSNEIRSTRFRSKNNSPNEQDISAPSSLVLCNEPTSPQSKHRYRSQSPQRRRHERGHRHRDSGRRRSRSPRVYSQGVTRDSARNERRRISRSRSPRQQRRSRSLSNSPLKRSRGSLPSQVDSFNTHRGKDSTEVTPLADKQKPNFKNTGLLAAETNKVTLDGDHGAETIILKYHEPSEARKPPPSELWNLYVFKGTSSDPLQTIPLYTRSCWLLGRETAVADIPLDHPSCSKQHAVFQFRYITKRDEYGEKRSSVKLYLLDLESANGSQLNGVRVEAARFVECFSGDVIKLGHSEREYVLLVPPKG